jgi:hypothetical protein
MADYDTMDEKKFIEMFEIEISQLIGISPSSVIVKSLNKGSINVEFVVVCDPATGMDATVSGNRLVEILKQNNTFPGVIMKNFNANESNLAFVHVPLFAAFDFALDDFDTVHNRDFGSYDPTKVDPNDKRGGRRYYPPAGWYRHALNVGKRYGTNGTIDPSWIGYVNGTGEWPVAYHGTNSNAGVSGIMSSGLLQAFVQRDAFEVESRSMSEKARLASGKGLYASPDVSVCEIDRYAREISVPIEGGVAKYLVAFQCRVEPTSFTAHHRGDGKSLKNDNRYWRIFTEDAIRPYGLLIKRV